MSAETGSHDPGGVVLFGPPAAGKDTISAALGTTDPRFRQLTKIKVGSGRTVGYRMTDRTELNDLRRAGRIVLETERYGNTYAVDKADLQAMREAGHVPLVHMGSVDHLRMFLTGVGQSWLCVLLWVPRQVCEERSLGRGDQDTAERLVAWDAARADLLSSPDRGGLFHVLLRTDQFDPDKASSMVAQAYKSRPWKAATTGEMTLFLQPGDVVSP